MFNLVCGKPLSRPPPPRLILPDDIVLYIFKFLTPRDIVGRASFISRQYRYLAVHKELWPIDDPVSMYQFQLIKRQHEVVFPVIHKPTGSAVILYRHRKQYIEGQLFKMFMEKKRFVLVTDDNNLLLCTEYKILPKPKKFTTIVSDELIGIIRLTLMETFEIFEWEEDDEAVKLHMFCLVRIIHYLQENEKEDNPMLTISFLIWALLALADKDEFKVSILLQGIIDANLIETALPIQLKVISYLLYETRRRVEENH